MKADAVAFAPACENDGLEAVKMRADAVAFEPAPETDAVDASSMRADAIAFTPITKSDDGDTTTSAVSAAAVAAAARMKEKGALSSRPVDAPSHSDGLPDARSKPRRRRTRGEASAVEGLAGVKPTDLELWTHAYAWQCAALAVAAKTAAWNFGADDDFSTAAPSPAPAGEEPSPWTSPIWGYEVTAATAAAAWCAEHLADMEAFALPEVDQNHEYVMDGLEDPTVDYAKAFFAGVCPETYYGGEADGDDAKPVAGLPPGLELPPGLDAPPGLEAGPDDVPAEDLDVPPGLETGPDGLHADGESDDEPQEESDDATGGVSTAATDPGLPAGCTTVMLRNIPNKYTRERLVAKLRSDGYGRDVDFLYLPVDFKNKCNVGYVFLNFRTEEACLKFYGEFNQASSVEKLPGFKSKKVCEVSPARCQGLEENTKRLQNSAVMLELARTPEWLPMVFDTNGQPLEFPVPEAIRQRASLASGESKGDIGVGVGGTRRSRGSRKSRAK